MYKKKTSVPIKSYPKPEGSVASTPPSPEPEITVKTIRTKSYDKSGVARLYSPFNRFGSPRAGDKLSNPYKSIYKPSGLSPKEKSYVISSCQTRTNRYIKLKALAYNAMNCNKIFSIYGSCNAVRDALLERGWVEKIPPNKMNLSKIRNGKFQNKSEVHGELERLLLSNLVEKASPNFVWKTKDENHELIIDMKNENYTMINKLKIDALWTSKQGLCSSIKRNYWFNIDEIAEMNCPRTYNSSEVGEIEDFVKDYKMTACTSLLKWVLSMVANKRPVFLETGNVSLNVIVFALNRCKEYLFRKQNKDIDHPISSKPVSSGQWNSFLKKYYRIIEKEEVFELDHENRLPLYLGYAKILLQEIHKYRPQLSCEGCHNIWIIKPANCSRGRGIRMASKLGVMTNLLNKINNKYVIQKYIEEPLLIHDTKFDIRQYYLVTSTYPLIIWCYKECYLKFSSQKYSLKNYHESIHLTNNAVQRKYKNCLGRHKDLPQQNMWDLDTYKEYLIKIGQDQSWDNIIYPGMKKSIIGIMLSCQDSLSVSKNRFEMYGCDFILDKGYRPWLIEINSCPDLNHTTSVTAKICPAAISDIIKVVIDNAANPRAPTGNFECIYRQPMTIPRYVAAAELFVKGYALPNEYFYKGNVEIKESYEDPDIGRERNLKSVLQKLKRYYDVDITTDPDENLEYNITIKNESTHVTESKMEKSDMNESETETSVATIITDHIRDLTDKITSEHSISNPSGSTEAAISTSTINVKKCIRKSRLEMKTNQSVKSDTTIDSLLRKSCSHVDCGLKKSFSFSKLDDGPCGKASYFDMIDFMTFPNENNFVVCKKRDLTKLSPSGLNIAEAALKMMFFMSKKEKEYCC
ncbi:tubulin glycylase 3A-like isoform X2 [Plodia interpunctella]|uniref:tubulin glycylase 3A-like isoform X2 n=1 Tax=Plodia interpunctella TaxID=58824 RepID=UPI002367A301|nr:tubulin glycylase 3A-like isoform X2 [Plodia interpunctella]